MTVNLGQYGPVTRQPGDRVRILQPKYMRHEFHGQMARVVNVEVVSQDGALCSVFPNDLETVS